MIDCITNDIIPPQNLITVFEGKACYNFDIDSLYRNYIHNKSLKNPYTGIEFEKELVNEIINYGNNNIKTLSFLNSDVVLKLPSIMKIGDMLLEILSATRRTLDIYTIDIIINDVSIFDYNFDDELSSIEDSRFLIGFLIPSNCKNLSKFLDFLVKTYGKDRYETLIELLNNHLKYGKIIKLKK